MAKTAREAEVRAPGRPRDEAARKRILDASLALMEEIGFANLTCDGIAERAGASKATVYRWWPNKAAVVIDAFVEAVTPDLPNEGAESVEEFVRMRLRSFARVLAGRNGRVLAAVVAASQNDPEVAAAFLAHWIKPRRSISRKYLERFQAEGTLVQHANIDQILDVMYGPLQFLLMTRRCRITTEYADSLASLVLHGLLPRNGDG
ncbi:MAG TPA: TetR/AcrR family transcriptional regulator [Clostridia bacterium]|nr:TetR/AcrR family transcriptional regulator [Clostridia bacterium]